MSNIWEVFLQSATVTLCAVMLLIVKNALRDKLSPRWQYGVWLALALRMLWPSSMSRTLLFNFPLWFEMLKTHFEKVGSTYAEKYVPLHLTCGLPWINGAPTSFADWLFIVYVLGILVFLLRHLWSYMRLRALLRLGAEPTAEVQEAMERVCARHGLRPCPVVTVPELPTAFVCGIFRPILAVPEGKIVDDKVLLHELLHLKHHDMLQNVLWCCLRSLHWWNIFLVPIFERISNDMESLCDQRVLEHLEGEERRAYGGILLDMASEKYARAPGTSSISNGGAFISERIENIARFKKYPRGMALVSLCIVFVLSLSFLGGTVRDYGGGNFSQSAYSLQSPYPKRSMAITRLARCRTPDAAIDAYAKAMLQRNAYFLATASPLEKQEEIVAAIEESEENYPYSVGIDVGPELEWLSFMGSSGYVVSGYTENADGTVDARLQFYAETLLDSEGNELVYEFERDGESFTEHGGIVLLNVRAEETDDGWVAYEHAPQEHYRDNELMRINMLRLMPGFEKTITTPHGSIVFRGLVQRSMLPFTGLSFFSPTDYDIHTDSEFTETLLIKAEYELWERSGEGFDPENITPEDWPGSSISVEVDTLWTEREPKFMFEGAMDAFHGRQTKSYENSYTYSSWSASFDKEYEVYPEPYEVALADAPWGYAVRICWDEAIVEELIIPLEEVLSGE